MKLSIVSLAWLPSVALAFQGAAIASEPDSQAPSERAAIEAQPVTPSGPALWKVSDEDTTIYLFGTVHALPKDANWFSGNVESALSYADELVTEIPASAAQDPASQQMVMGKAMLAEGQSLRAMLNDTDRASYESALTNLGVPAEAFDRFEPWFASINLGIIPLMKEGYSAESGVETMIDKRAPADAERIGLETLTQQIDLFDSLPEKSQVAFMMVAANNIDQIAPLMKRMVDEWLEGDADQLSVLMNAGLTDPVLAQTLLYDRNERWAEWVDARLDRPGTVFMAVGAGHLAGERSVQDFLVERGIGVARVQ